MEPRNEEQKKKRFRIVKLEERVVPATTLVALNVPGSTSQGLDNALLGNDSRVIFNASRTDYSVVFASSTGGGNTYYC